MLFDFVIFWYCALLLFVEFSASTELELEFDVIMIEKLMMQ
jgi:hypothetical protein